MELKGKYATVKVFADSIEDTAKEQILTLLDQPFVQGERIRIMPDVHAGKGCTIGTTMTLRNRKVVPNMVGVDIGCGMLCAKLIRPVHDLELFDEVVRSSVPSGFDVHAKEKMNPDIIRRNLYCGEHIDAERAAKSLGSLGGGNHFIELCEDQDRQQYLVIHTGPRHLGVEVASYYQEEAYRRLVEQRKTDRDNLIRILKKSGAQKYISAVLTEFDLLTDFDKELAYCEGDLFSEYLHDMRYVQKFAAMNRGDIAFEIQRAYSVRDPDPKFKGSLLWAAPSFEYADSFDTIHNYIEYPEPPFQGDPILRKGACRARVGERLLIPMNMRDGSLLCRGKGNPDWNNSAPHGAGRIMPRAQARATLLMEDYREQMKNVFSTSVTEDTIDEAPGAYKPMDEILRYIGDTVEVESILKPIYNFKAG